MSILRIYFSGSWRDSTSPCPWALCEENGTVLQSGNDPLAALPKGKECIAIAAPDRVLSISAKLPPGSRRRWQAALPFAAEEHTLPDPEDSHVVPGPALADGHMLIAVVDKPWLRRIVEACRTANLPLRRMVPETFLPPLAPETWTLMWDGSSGFMRTGAASGMALDTGGPHTAPLALHLSLNSARNNSPASLPGKIEVRFPQHVPEAQRILPQWNLPTILSAGPVWDWRRAPVPADALNLLWGDFAPRARISEWWPQLRPAALILLAALGVEAIGANIEWALLAHEKKTLTQDMERSFRTAFGEAGTLVNAPLQMQRNLADLRHSAGLPDDGDFLPLLDASAPTLATLPAGSVRGLHYESGRFDVDIKLSRGSDIQDLRQHLQNKGLGVQIGDIHDVGDGAEARLTLLPGDGR
ncbi:type II secretion system protein L [Ferrigenium kumadai]|uniref:Type II secretion system protein L n=1 Tax=Ferrigenium kumadai TaxID=1682490 RepID=A0AAN1W0J1_9PROT|nr:type II secretion system protein GspL [Ferrigenium kumadai]BBJ00431.1 type II secretion system protein L [Ferrigenium kumadai]